MQTGDSSRLTGANSQVPERLQRSRPRRVGVVAWEMTTEGLGKLVAYFLSSHYRARTTHSPCSCQRSWRNARGGFVFLVPCPSGMDQRADAMGKSIDWAIRRVRLAGSIWPCQPDLTMVGSAGYAGRALRASARWVAGIALGTDMDQGAMRAVRLPLAC
jgi:hypothetical protein